MDPGSKQVKPGPKKGQGKTPQKPGAPGAKPAPAAKPEVTESRAQQARGVLSALRSGNEDAIPILRFIVYVQTMVIFVLALVFCYAKFNIPTDPIAFSIDTETKKPSRLIGLPRPTLTQQAIMSWVGSASADILNFGFHNVYERLQGTKKYFTDDGWKSFTEAVKSSEIISRITEKQQVITAAPIGTPVILKTADNIQYGKEWTIQVPIYVTVLSGKETDSKRRTLTLVLVTVPPDKNLSGLGIDRWIESQ